MSIDEIVKELLIKLRFGNLEENPTRIMGGLLNKMYKVKTSTGTYAIKHLNPELINKNNAKENIIITELIASKVKESGVSSAPAITVNGKLLHELNNNFFLVFDWIEGTTISNNNASLEHIRKVATMLAQIHNIDFGKIKWKCNQPNNLFEVNWNYYINTIKNAELKDLLEKSLDKLYEIDKNSTCAVKSLSGEMVVSHRDMDLLNIIWNEKIEPFVIDWELAGLVNPSEEAIETAWNWSGGHEYFDIIKFKYFIEVYKSNGGNTKDLNNAIYSCFKNNAGWLEYNLKRASGIECTNFEEQKIGEKEAYRVINKVITFYELGQTLIE